MRAGLSIPRTVLVCLIQDGANGGGNEVAGEKMQEMLAMGASRP